MTAQRRMAVLCQVNERPAVFADLFSIFIALK